MTESAGALWNITFLFNLSLYGNHLSIITDCGLAGNGANLSIITFLGGGGNRFPEIVLKFFIQVIIQKISSKRKYEYISLRPIGIGGWGGASRTINGSGVAGLGGCWRIMSGGAGGTIAFFSFTKKFNYSKFVSYFFYLCIQITWVIIISPGVGGVGGLRYLTANSCTYSICCATLLLKTSGFGSSLIR